MSKTESLPDLARTIQWARFTVEAAIPIPAGTLHHMVEHLLALREIAFENVMPQVINYEYPTVPEDLLELSKGRVPPPR